MMKEIHVKLQCARCNMSAVAAPGCRHSTVLFADTSSKSNAVKFAIQQDVSLHKATVHSQQHDTANVHSHSQNMT